MSYKRTGNPPGRPRTLPDLNPEVPSVISSEYPNFTKEIEQAITASKTKQPNSDLLWLNLTRKFRAILFASHRIMGGQFQSISLSHDQVMALEWLRKKGRYIWQQQSRRQIANSRSSAISKDVSCVVGPSTPKPTKQQRIRDTTVARSAIITSTE